MAKLTQAEVVRDLFLESSIVSDLQIKEALNLSHDNFAAVLQPLKKAGWKFRRNRYLDQYELLEEGNHEVSIRGPKNREKIASQAEVLEAFNQFEEAIKDMPEDEEEELLDENLEIDIDKIMSDAEIAELEEKVDKENKFSVEDLTNQNKSISESEGVQESLDTLKYDHDGDSLDDISDAEIDEHNSQIEQKNMSPGETEKIPVDLEQYCENDAKLVSPGEALTKAQEVAEDQYQKIYCYVCNKKDAKYTMTYNLKNYLDKPICPQCVEFIKSQKTCVVCKLSFFENDIFYDVKGYENQPVCRECEAKVSVKSKCFTCGEMFLEKDMMKNLSDSYNKPICKTCYEETSSLIKCVVCDKRYPDEHITYSAPGYESEPVCLNCNDQQKLILKENLTKCHKCLELKPRKSLKYDVPHHIGMGICEPCADKILNTFNCEKCGTECYSHNTTKTCPGYEGKPICSKCYPEILKEQLERKKRAKEEAKKQAEQEYLTQQLNKTEYAIELLYRVRQNTLLTGPTGCGKTYLAQKIAKKLDLECVVISVAAGLAQEDLIGKRLPNSTSVFEYFMSEFVRLYKFGGVFVADEMDAADPEIILVLNNALAGDHFTVDSVEVGERKVNRHKDFVMVATTNTLSGADEIHTARQQLDGATLSRFRAGIIEMDYDKEYEKSVISNKEFRDWCWDVRQKIRDNEGLSDKIMDTRFMKDGQKLLDNGATVDFLKTRYFSGWPEDEISAVDNKFLQSKNAVYNK